MKKLFFTLHIFLFFSLKCSITPQWDLCKQSDIIVPEVISHFFLNQKIATITTKNHARRYDIASGKLLEEVPLEKEEKTVETENKEEILFSPHITIINSANKKTKSLHIRFLQENKMYIINHTAIDSIADCIDWKYSTNGNLVLCQESNQKKETQSFFLFKKPFEAPFYSANTKNSDVKTAISSHGNGMVFLLKKNKTKNICIRSLFIDESTPKGYTIYTFSNILPCNTESIDHLYFSKNTLFLTTPHTIYFFACNSENIALHPIYNQIDDPFCSVCVEEKTQTLIIQHKNHLAFLAWQQNESSKDYIVFKQELIPSTILPSHITSIKNDLLIAYKRNPFSLCCLTALYHKEQNMPPIINPLARENKLLDSAYSKHCINEQRAPSPILSLKKKLESIDDDDDNSFEEEFVPILKELIPQDINCNKQTFLGIISKTTQSLFELCKSFLPPK